MRLLIATPAYGGQFQSNYMLSLVSTIQGLTQAKIGFTFFTVVNDALISRARNWCAAMALEGGYDKMLFIDSDVGWRWEDMAMLLRSDKLVVGGTYAVKALPTALNYNVALEHVPLLDQGRNTPESHARLRAVADPVTGEIAVRHIPTGFMLIDCSVLRKLQSVVAAYEQAIPNQPKRAMHDFFPVRVHDGHLESEDWAFCSLCRENGIEIFLNTNIVVTHVGSFMFRGTAGNM